MSELPLHRRLHHYSDMTSVVLGLLFNSTLLVIASKNKEKGLKSFSEIVFMNCILDISLNVMTLLGEIEVTTHQGVFYFMTNSFLARMIPPQWHYLIIYLFCISIGFSVFYAPIPFLQRYSLICRGKSISHKRILTLLVLPMSISIWIVSWQVYAMLQTDSRRSELAPALNNSMWIPENYEVPMFVAFPIDSFPSKMYQINCLIFFPLAYGLPFYFFTKIYRNFKENQLKMSTRVRKLHRSLNRALVAQALIPFILGSIPNTILMISLSLRVDIPYFPNIASSMVSWVPVVNPFMTLMFVPSYYRSLLPRDMLIKLLITLVDQSTIQQQETSTESRQLSTRNEKPLQKTPTIVLSKAMSRTPSRQTIVFV